MTEPYDNTEFNPFRELINQMHDGVYFVSPDRTITFWSRGAERISGFRAEQVVGRRCYDNILCHVDAEGKSLCADCCPLAAAIRDHENRCAEVYMRHRDGHRLPVSVRASPFRNSDGEVVGGVEVFSSAASRLADIEKIRRLESEAFVDPLTGLPNRRYATTAISAKLAEHALTPMALMVIDIDRFKLINDTHGHANGDEVLKAVARTIGAMALHAGDTAARWGGEEFVMAIAASPEEAVARAQALRAMVQDTRVTLANGTGLSVTVSIGLTFALEHDTLGTLFDRADRALYRAKFDGRNRVCQAEPQQA